MAHWAKVINDIVTKVIVAEPEYFDTLVDDEPGMWVKTSYNTRGGVHYEPESNHSIPSADQTKALRKNYAGTDYTYDSVKDAFIPPQPYSSYTLNETTCLWEPPITIPDGVGWKWDEDAYQADTSDPKTAGWVNVSYVEPE
jgi:hypothetical protein